MVVMSMETYEEQLRRLEYYQELAISEGVLHLTGLKCILP
jgi:hypothetical protein